MPDVCRVFAGVSGSPGSVHALRQAAELARHHDAILIPLLAWVPPDSNRLPWPGLRQLWQDDAWQKLWDTLDTAFGGLPAGIDTRPMVLRGKSGQVLTGAARQPSDVLVIGAGLRGRRLATAGPPAIAWPTPTARCGHPAPRPGPASRLRPARLGVAAPLEPGHSPVRIAERATCSPARPARGGEHQPR